jgi:formylglycine-generating enzyme required for sulfatase activity
MRLISLALPIVLLSWGVVAGSVGAQTLKSKPGTVFRDCADCPEMVVLPPGMFTMGSADSEAVRDKDEGPQRQVSIARPFAVSKFEVTRGEFGQFIRETGHVAVKECSVWAGTKSERMPEKSWADVNTPQTDAHPVGCISWHDAKAFIAWMSQKAGKPYRMLSEAEWEYAARAGSTGKYSFGDNADDLCKYGNVADTTAKEAGGGNWVYANCRDGFGISSAPVGSFAPNRFGLYDMHGNVWEWVEDCGHDSYVGAPVDGSARTDGECKLRIDRGGGWYNNRGTNRAAERAFFPPTGASGNIGLRLARPL